MREMKWRRLLDSSTIFENLFLSACGKIPGQVSWSPVYTYLRSQVLILNNTIKGSFDTKLPE